MWVAIVGRGTGPDAPRRGARRQFVTRRWGVTATDLRVSMMMSTMIRPVALLGAFLLVACQPSASVAPTPATGSTAQPQASPGASAGPSAAPSPGASAAGTLAFGVERYPVTPGAHPHDVAVASDGGIWYTGQQNETLGWLDPATGDVREAKLPSGAAPHGVITGPDGAAWVTDQGLQAIVRVTPGDFEVDVFPVPGRTSPHTGVFDHDGILWFTGAAGFIGRLDPATGEVRTFEAPRGNGPYGITVTPSNDVWFVSLDKSYLGKVDKASGAIEVIEPPTTGAGTRRVWSDSTGRLWISYWNAGKLGRLRPRRLRRGRSGTCRAAATRPTRCTSTSWTPSGSRTSVRTRSCASTR